MDEEHTTSELILPIIEITEQEELVKQPIIIEKEKKLYKNWRPKEDPRQEIINETYKLWWMDQVILHECEWYDWDMYKIWDWWHAFWLCQMNDRFHNIPDQYYTDRRFQIKYCNMKRKGWSLFYWPERVMDKETGEMCMSYSKKYFYLE